MKKITVSVVVKDEDEPSIVEAAKNMLPTWDIKIEDISKQTPKALLRDKSSFHVVNEEALSEIREWAECQGLGVLVHFPGGSYHKIMRGED